MHVLGVGGPAPLAGRKSELAALCRLLDEAGPGTPATAEITGDPGIGKTRLLAEVAAEARGRGWAVLHGCAVEVEQQVPFAVLSHALGDRLATVDQAALEAADLRLLRWAFPGLAPAAPGDAGPELPPSERYRLYRAVRLLLESPTEPPGLVFILDDLHWADDGTAEFVGFLLRHPPRGRLLLVVAHRPRQLPARLGDALGRGVRDGAVERVQLGPLTPEEAGELMPAGLDQAQRRGLLEAGGGNPFYLQALAARPAAAMLDDPPAEAARAALLAELAGLTPAQLAVARACAVAGDGADADLVAHTAGLPLDEVLRLLDELAARDLIRVGSTGGGFAFRHPLVRQAVYDAAGRGWRLAAHARAATALREAGAPAVEVAYHLEPAARRGDAEAIGTLHEAATATLHRSPATAAHWLAAASRLVPDVPEALFVRLDLLTMRANALALTGRLRDSRHALHELRRLLPAGMAEERAQVTAYCALVERLLGRHAEARAQLMSELAAVPDQHGPAAFALKTGLALGVAFRAEPGVDRDWPAEALATARRLADPLGLVCALGIAVVSRHTTGDLGDDVEGLLDEAVGLADALPDAELAPKVEALIWLGWAEVCHERLTDGVRHLTRAWEVAHASEQSHVLNSIHETLGAVHLLRGDLQRSAAHLRDGLDAAYLTGSTAAISAALRGQSWIAIWTGDFETALRLGAEALAHAEDGDATGARLSAGILGAAHLYTGDPEVCVELMAAGGGGPDLWNVDPVERNNWYCILAAAEAALGRPKEAAAWADRAFAHAAGLPRRTGLAYLARSAALLADDPDGAAAAALQAVHRLRAAGDRIGTAHALVAAGSAFAARPDLDSARRHFAEAGELFRSCGAPGHAENVVRQQRRMNARQPRRRQAGPGPVDQLTARERQVAELAARGLTSREIGEELYLSPKTVNVHLGRIFAKLGVARRAAVASRLAELPGA